MSRLDVARPGAPGVAAGGRWTWARRLWGAPLWVHAGALAVILTALLAVVGTSSSFSADEGAAIVQARSLARGDGWVVEHPVPEADPTGTNYPLELSERGPDGVAPFGKHPLYAVLLAGADRLGGTTGMVLMSTLGTLVAAVLAAALARRIDPGLARPALWAVGLASPLLFDGYVVIAHTLGAALVAGAVLMTVATIDRRRPLLALGVVPLVGAAVLLRREALILALALAVVAAALAVRRSPVRPAASAVAIGALATAATAPVLEQLWTRRLLGGSLAWSGVKPPGSGSAGLVAGRLQAFFLTWLTPSYGLGSIASLSLLVMVGAIVVAAIAVRRGRDHEQTVTRSSVVAALAAVIALASGPTNLVPGFLVAFPLAAAGFLLIRRATVQTLTAQVAFGVFVLFALGVIATQYSKGGAGEWGGRYFAIGVPFLVPVLLLALREAGAALDRQVRRKAVVALAVCSLALAAISVSTLRHFHHRTAELVALADRAGKAAGGDRPVLVTTQGAVPRFAWATFDRQRWLLSDPHGVADVLGRLRAAGVSRAAFVTRDLERDRAQVLSAASIVSTNVTPAARGWHVLVLDLV